MNRWEWIKFLGIEPDCVGIKLLDSDSIFPWKDVNTCMDDEVEPPIEGLTACPKCGEELRWIHFCSPNWTWQHFCGREGSLAICDNCHKQVYFRCEKMN